MPHGVDRWNLPQCRAPGTAPEEIDQLTNTLQAFRVPLPFLEDLCAFLFCLFCQR